MDIDYETDVNSMSLTCEANNASMSRLYDPLTVLGSDPNCTKTLQLSRSTNATVYVSVTASAIRLRVSFVASVELNGTVIKCYSETDGGREDTTTINITGNPKLPRYTVIRDNGYFRTPMQGDLWFMSSCSTSGEGGGEGGVVGVSCMCVDAPYYSTVVTRQTM